MKAEKHIIVTGYSNISWKDAIVKSIDTASQTLDSLTNLTVLKQQAIIKNNKIVEYLVDLDISFFIEDNTCSENCDEQDSL